MNETITTNFTGYTSNNTTGHTVPVAEDKSTYGRRSTDHRIDFDNYNRQPYIEPCAFDNLPPDCQGKPMMLYCSCPKCSPRC